MPTSWRTPIRGNDALIICPHYYEILIFIVILNLTFSNTCLKSIDEAILMVSRPMCCNFARPRIGTRQHHIGKVFGVAFPAHPNVLQGSVLLFCKSG